MLINMELSLFSLVLFICVCSYGAQIEEGPIVSTKSGKIQGFIEKSTKEKVFYTFNGIPFAEPPIGKLRFKNPEVAKPWQGIKDGTQDPVSCSIPEILLYYKNKEKLFLGQEDCLHLFVSTPKIDQELLPVLLFIHGGGFMGGSSGVYTGHELLNENIVYVAINYRLGVLGFLSTEDDVMPGNLGLKDQTMALKWVQENIMFFGGDPNRVTIFGESAGGASVHYHVLSPYSKGLYKRAILQSGTSLCPWTHSKGHKSIAHQLGVAVGCFTPADIGEKQSERLLSCLQNIDAERLTMMGLEKFQIWNFLPNVFTPYVDGNYLPDEPEILLRDGKHNDVEIMIGLNKDEGSWITESLYSDNNQIQLLENKFGYYGPISLGMNYENSSQEITKTIFNHYLGQNIKITEKNSNAVTEMYGDAHFKICSDIVTIMHSNNIKSAGKKVYHYELEYKGERSLLDIYQIKFGMHWIGHADDVFFLFPMQSMGGFPKRSENDQTMRDIFTRLWTNFATTGNPTPDSSLGFKWDSFTQDSSNYLSLKLEPEMKPDKRKEVRQFWNSLPTLQNILLNGPEKKEYSQKYEL